MPLLKKNKPTKEQKLDGVVKDRIARVGERLRREAPKVKEAYEFTRGNHYAYVADNDLRTLPTRTFFSLTGPKGKPPHRVRHTRNLIFDVVLQEVAAGAGRIPSYEVVSSTADFEDIAAASLGEKVLLAGFEQWGVRLAFRKLIFHALHGEGFIRPYFDNQIGKPIDENFAEGDIRHRVYSKLEVGWENNVRFEDAKWIVIRQSRPISEVKAEPNYMGGDLKADAVEIGTARKVQGSGSDLVLVTEYIERPTPKNPNGLFLTIANDKIIFPPESYPVKSPDGYVCDEPVLFKLSYAIDADSDRDLGLIPQLIDPMRTYEDCINKLLEWKNLALNPQILAPKNSLLTSPSDEHGLVVEYRPVGGQIPQWKPTPPLPSELFQLAENAKEDIARLSALNEIPSQVESGKAIALYNEKDRSRRGDFLQGLADVYGAVGKRDLQLVQTHYTEQRLLKVQGRFGFEPIPDFRGADLRGQDDVRVNPGSLEPRTTAGIEQRAQNLLQVGAITPFQYLTAVEGGEIEKLSRSYLLDIRRAHEIMQSIRNGTFLGSPPRPLFPGEEHVDLETGQPATSVPSWMPRPFDKIEIHKTLWEDWMKTSDFSLLPDEGKEAAMLYYATLLNLEQQKVARAQAAQAQQAEDLGMQNATNPPGKPMPSLPSVTDTPR